MTRHSFALGLSASGRCSAAGWADCYSDYCTRKSAAEAAAGRSTLEHREDRSALREHEEGKMGLISHSYTNSGSLKTSNSQIHSLSQKPAPWSPVIGSTNSYAYFSHYPVSLQSDFLLIPSDSEQLLLLLAKGSLIMWSNCLDDGLRKLLSSAYVDLHASFYGGRPSHDPQKPY
ncbi:hypothetical protein MHYP_G00207630 [Metynnis hypsauchen]